jgi:hypothetical protein
MRLLIIEVAKMVDSGRTNWDKLVINSPSPEARTTKGE